ncbi:phage tail tape measure protein [Rossellomorea vietnamensis]|uniref:phage tail tape measure protein n=1 Tax=Rossellomorea vietnamensis TaxID=218284 RepID=UPI0006919D03|nr:phage tail tape measure protein [Rossellomorea vietnamensis]
MAINLGELRARLTMDAQEFTRRMREARGSLEETRSSTLRARESFSKMQTAMFAVAAAVGTGLGASINVARNFEEAMSRVKAISGATGDEFEALKAKAKELGATTQFSATEAAQGMEYLSMAGFKVNDIIGAMPSVLNLAAAAKLDLGRSADIVSNIMTGFGVKAEDASGAVDVLVKTMTTANTDLPQLGDAMKYVAPVASSLGLSIEETAAAVAKMSDAGIQGSQAGTSLRAALLSLSNPVGQTEKAMNRLNIEVLNSEGNMKSLPELIGHVSEKMEGMTDAQKTATAAQLVGTEAASGFVTLLGVGEDALADYTKTLENSGGTAERVAKTQMENLNGALKELQSAAEGLGIEIGEELLPVITDFVKYGIDIVRMVQDMDSATLQANIAFVGTTAAIGAIITTLVKFGVAIRGLFVSLGPAGWLIAGLSLLGGAIVSANVYQKEFNEVNLESVNALQEQKDKLSANITEYEKLSSKSRLTNDELARFVDINSELNKTANPEIIAQLKEQQQYLYEKSGLSNDELDRMITLNGQIVEAVPESNTVLTEQGNILLDNTDAAREFNAEQVEMIRLELEAKRTKLEANMEENLRKEEEAQKAINRAKERMIELDQMEKDEIGLISQLEADLAAAKERGDTLEIDRLNETIALHKNKLSSIDKQQAEQAELVLEKAKEVDKIQQEIGKLDTVKQQMVEIELKQAGINAKKGEEMRTLENELGTLYQQKSELDNIKDAATRNTAEYRQAKAEIEAKIGKLEGVRSKIQSIIGTADAMNSRLGQSITKRIYIEEYGAKSYSQARRAYEGVGGSLYHTGGVVGMPRLHTGGMASQFASAPSHNEIDVRLLRNETVLTEAQQSNLFKMIDAGMSPGADSAMREMAMEVLNILSSINQNIKNKSGNVYFDNRAVGKVLEPIITEFQNYKAQDKKAF